MVGIFWGKWDGKEKVLSYINIIINALLIGLGKNEQGILYPIIVIKDSGDRGIIINRNKDTDF